MASSQVKKSVRDPRPGLWQPIPNLLDLIAPNDWRVRRCVELWREIQHQVLPGSVADA